MSHCTWKEAIDTVGRESGKPDAVFCLTWCAVLGLGVAFLYLVYLTFVAVVHAAQWAAKLF